ncbi:MULTISPECIES: potassium-transporting ATPase subunit KdpB [unclassified Mycolicibacterium]|uniref:potassium-transporting ATPase subunit KdpB n=1 Tax=unclassified Mycolicibacterium TaxID=2636767 RepID=UPI0012DCB0D8|nr:MULTISPECIES: potassium-transporting ATPase subunit KdpB [unclassified Mycolicibacterium]MUL85246.1 potassium-transporting ATPase subunit KdpB [Mycolicibacterium sp. CBMA 329]MUL91213.1 potassium-transporting ATPase subunit KdpB [Mycolicibacterium sp. CBMA 331]MUL98118.1 potassium-transporting ATPase subunit KdpB [Mycolicibacterium sp. CBMA 334]MUM25782.1 potassium-transporting ATPase subunit KdpB [Mycolicibacterium sp. CBMA 295]MUM40972.1 potassium-transporting ATPase subunit KdpB [Mycolic
MSVPTLDSPSSTQQKPGNSKRIQGGLLDPKMLLRSTPDALRKLDPRTLWRNPVMFIVEIGAVWSTILAVLDPSWFSWLIVVWLWLTVIFANLAEAVAEGRGKAQAESLRKTKTSTMARRLTGWSPGTAGHEEEVAAPLLQQGDVVVVEAGQVIPGDGDVVEGIASVDESAITGESAPVIRESGGDRSAVTGGTTVLSDRIVVRVTQKPGESFIDRMINLVEGANRQKTPNEVALNILLASLTIIFVFAVATLQPLAIYSKANNPGVLDTLALNGNGISSIVMVSLLVCLIPTTIGALLSAIGIAGMDRLVQRNVLAMSGRAVEAAGDVNTLLLDKTGTITLGNRQAAAFVPLSGITEDQLADAAQLSSLADETPEGRSIVVFAKQQYGLRGRTPGELDKAHWVEFSANTRMSGVDLSDDHRLRKGAAGAVAEWVRSEGGRVPTELGDIVDGISAAGGTPLVVGHVVKGKAEVLGVIHLKDVVKQGMRERFDEMRRMGIRTVMITGDNPLTAKAIADEAGVDDFLAEATPEDKMALIKKEQAGGKLVAMTGDGTNDAPALAQADVGVAMNSGTSAAKEAGNMVDLDSDPTKLIEIVEIGKQLLITRGALTTFSIANDIAKYFAIIPALFVALFPGLDTLNIMRLHSPQSAILSAVIFNAIIIVVLIPLALKGVRYTPSSASKLLSRNLYVYGLGGIIAPFIGIKLIDLIVQLFPGM